jgi:DNA (cytosine-5)-methyltransferase 1
MKYFSLFTGVGGFELGIEKVDESAECVGFSEIDKYASQVLKYKFPNVKNYGDITKINWFEVPDFDLLVGGSPCQDFSIAGKRAGISGERSGLVWEFIRCLEEKKPQYFIWENVKGVMSSRKGLDFGSILTAFSESGYSLWWQVLNAKDFGVPQNRERIFVVGFRDRCPREVFFERGDGAEITSPPPVRKQSSNTIRTNYSNGRSNETYVLKEITQNQSQGYRVYDPKGIATNQASQAGGVGAKTGLYAIPVLTPDRLVKRQNGRRMKTDGEPSFTINTQDRHGIFNGSRIRRLTPTECERLMSWPDGHTKYGINEKGEKVEISDTQRYRQCGNGVVSEVVAAIVKELLLPPPKR